MSIAKDRVAPTPPEPTVNSLFEGIVLTTLFGLGIIFGGVVAMKSLEVNEALITAYMIIGSLAFFGIYGLYVRQFFQLDRSKQVRSTAHLRELDTKELDAAQAYTLAEPPPSATEHTTRRFEPIYNERQAK